MSETFDWCPECALDKLEKFVSKRTYIEPTAKVTECRHDQNGFMVFHEESVDTYDLNVEV